MCDFKASIEYKNCDELRKELLQTSESSGKNNISYPYLETYFDDHYLKHIQTQFLYASDFNRKLSTFIEYIAKPNLIKTDQVSSQEVIPFIDLKRESLLNLLNDLIERLSGENRRVFVVIRERLSRFEGIQESDVREFIRLDKHTTEQIKMIKNIIVFEIIQRIYHNYQSEEIFDVYTLFRKNELALKIESHFIFKPIFGVFHIGILLTLLFTLISKWTALKDLFSNLMLETFFGYYVKLVGTNYGYIIGFFVFSLIAFFLFLAIQESIRFWNRVGRMEITFTVPGITLQILELSLFPYLTLLLTVMVRSHPTLIILTIFAIQITTIIYVIHKLKKNKSTMKHYIPLTGQAIIGFILMGLTGGGEISLFYSAVQFSIHITVFELDHLGYNRKFEFSPAFLWSLFGIQVTLFLFGAYSNERFINYLQMLFGIATLEMIAVNSIRFFNFKTRGILN